MPSLKITQQCVSVLQPREGRDTIYWDTELPGFGVKVTASGQRSYIVQSRIQKGRNKRRVRLADCSSLPAQEARQQARKQLASMRLGHDPITERKAIELASMTLRKALEDRIQTKRLKTSTAEDYRYLAGRAFPDWLDSPISTISGQMAIDRHRKLTSEQGAVQANYAMRILSSAFNHARGAHGLQATNPVQRLREGKLFNRVRPRDAYVEPHELPAMLTTLRRMELAKLNQDRAEQEAALKAGLSWHGMRSRMAQACNGYTTPMHYAGAADIVRVLLLTGFRLEEAQGLEWSSVDLQCRIITLSDNKASRTLRMPMCGALVALMTRRADRLRLPDGTLPQWVFPYGDGRYDGLTSRVMPALSRAVSQGFGKPFHVYAHKLRHTFATYLRAMGHSEWTVAALLNHSRGSVTSIYAAPMTGSMHRIVDEYQNWLLKLLEPAGDGAATLLTGCDAQMRGALMAARA